MAVEEHPEMLYRRLGRTGETVSAIGLGGFHLAEQIDESLAVRIVRKAVDHGITFMDNCWDYNDGASEDAHGQGPSRRLPRQGLPHDQDRRPHEEGGGARSSTSPPPPADRPHRSRAAPRDHPLRGPAPHLRASRAPTKRCSRPSDAGKIRFIGFTGHKDPHIHLHMLDVAAEHGFIFDAVQMPLNVMDAHFRSFEHLVLPRLVGGADRRPRHEDAWRVGSHPESQAS